MDIKQLNEELIEVLGEDFKPLKENIETIDDVVKSVEIQVRDTYDGSIEVADLIHEFSDRYFGDYDTVLDLFKEIAVKNNSVYREVLRAVYDEVYGRVEDKLEDLTI